MVVADVDGLQSGDRIPSDKLQFGGDGSAPMDRSVLVTGGASGIGRATAERFAREGADVVVVDVDAEGADAAAAIPFAESPRAAADVTDPGEVETAVAVARDEHGPVDVLVNAAGVPDLEDPLEAQSVDDWQRIVDVHLRGTYLVATAVLSEMRDRELGAVVNVSSVTSFGAFPSSTAYGPAKSAVNNLTKVLAVEAAADGVRVNAVAPGFVHTPMVDPLFADGTLDRDAITGRIPAGRMAQPEEIADAISLLCDDRAGYVTGVVLPVDGGWNAYGYV